jgi:hypothetical protein
MSYDFINRDLSADRERPTACPWCHQILAVAGSCASSIVVMGDETFDRIRYGNETFFNEPESPDGSLTPDPRCPDCNVVVEGWHHGDCAVEQCIQCGGRLAECACNVEDGIIDVAARLRVAESECGTVLRYLRTRANRLPRGNGISGRSDHSTWYPSPPHTFSLALHYNARSPRTAVALGFPRRAYVTGGSASSRSRGASSQSENWGDRWSVAKRRSGVIIRG